LCEPRGGEPSGEMIDEWLCDERREASGEMTESHAL
jgi:hypothetical protein